MKVFVYYNLHKHLWSIKALEGDSKGKVIARLNTVLLHNPKPKVSEAGRQRVIREQKKNVHAGIIGEWGELFPLPTDTNAREITYNPYKYSSFVYKDNEEEYTGSSVALLGNNRSVLAIGETK